MDNTKLKLKLKTEVEYHGWGTEENVNDEDNIYNNEYYSYMKNKHMVESNLRDYHDQINGARNKLEKMKKDMKFGSLFAVFSILGAVIFLPIVMIVPAFTGVYLVIAFALFYMVTINLENVIILYISYMFNKGEGTFKGLHQKGYKRLSDEIAFCEKAIKDINAELDRNLMPGEITEDDVNRIEGLAIYREVRGKGKIREMGIIDAVICLFPAIGLLGTISMFL